MDTIRNFITLVGSIEGSTNITEFDNGQRVARFKLATQKRLRKNNGRYIATVEWHRLFAWGSMAQFIEKYGEKGKKVAIHGRMIQRTYLTQNGKQRSVKEVEVRQIIGLS